MQGVISHDLQNDVLQLEAECNPVCFVQMCKQTYCEGLCNLIVAFQDGSEHVGNVVDVLDCLVSEYVRNVDS